ncbi:MAG: hypothetical protein K2X81_16385 [Candidatus Obscuribacterales bacterium]|nr:hypothetical protein [Candidatus Obscuribacterales bacterium]
MTAAVMPETSNIKPYPWLFNPGIDLMFCCGGVFWLLVAAHLYFSKGHQYYDKLPWETALILGGSALLANPHMSATMVRLYGTSETRNKLWFYSYVVALITVVLMGFSCANTIVLSLLIRLYASLTFDHTISQNFGITLMYCYKSKYMFANWERLCLRVLYHSLAWYAILRQFTYREFCPRHYLGFDVPMLGPLPEIFCQTALAVLVASSVTFASVVLRNAIVKKQFMPLPAAVLLVTSLIMFAATLQMSAVFFMFTPAFFHSIQYLVITTSYNLRDRGLTDGVEPAKVPGLLLGKENLRYWGRLLLIGTTGLGLLPLAVSYAFHVPFLTAWTVAFMEGRRGETTMTQVFKNIGEMVCNLFQGEKASEMDRLRKIADKPSAPAQAFEPSCLADIGKKGLKRQLKTLSSNLVSANEHDLPTYCQGGTMSHQEQMLNVLLLQFDNGSSHSDSAIWGPKAF